MNESKKYWQDMWNTRYQSRDQVYGDTPNSYFQKFIDKQPAGSILLPAEAEGRNSIYAAKAGWDVYAFDFSTVAREKALQRADRVGVKIQYVTSDYETANYDTDQFDAVALIYAHMHTKIRRDFHRRVISWIKPGGHLVLEAFSKDQLGKSTGGPQTLELLYDLQELKLDFEGLTIIEAIAQEIELDAGMAHQGIGSIIRLTGQKQN